MWTREREEYATLEEKCAITEGKKEHVNIKHMQVELKHTGP